MQVSARYFLFHRRTEQVIIYQTLEFERCIPTIRTTIPRFESRDQKHYTAYVLAEIYPQNKNIGNFTPQSIKRRYRFHIFMSLAMDKLLANSQSCISYIVKWIIQDCKNRIRHSIDHQTINVDRNQVYKYCHNN